MEPIKFRVSFLPTSMNRMYGYNGHTKTMYLTEEARHYKMALKLACPKLEFVKENSIIEVHIDLHSPKWLCKNGRYRKIDGQNLTKLVYDAISERIGKDDSMFFFTPTKKILDLDEYTEITIKEADIEDYKTQGYKDTELKKRLE